MQSPDSPSGAAAACARLADRLLERPVLLASGLGTVFCMLGFQYLTARLGGPMLDELQGYDREALTDHLLLYGAAGRSLHQIFTLTLDMVFPLVYGAFFGGLLGLAARPFASVARLAPAAVLPVMLVDWTENLQLAALLGGFPDLSDAQIAAASFTTQVKFGLIAALFAVLGGLAALRLVKAALRR